MSIQAPNYTQFPNIILDEYMEVMSGAEFKIISFIIRKTLGWHKERDRISSSQIREKTGLSKNAVIEAIKMLKERKIITVKRTGKGKAIKTYYELDIDEHEYGSEIGPIKDSNGAESEPINELNGAESEPTKERFKEIKNKENTLDKPAASTPVMRIEKEYFTIFNSEFSDDADYNFPGCRKLINKYLKTHSEEKIIELLQIWFYTGVGAWHGYRFLNLQNDWNKLLIIYNSLQMHMLTEETYTIWAKNIAELNERDNKHFEVPDYEGWRKKEIQRRFEEVYVSA